MGREATVNYPTVDLKFRNDSKAGVLIRTSYSSTSITVTFYGDKEGKTVTEDGRKVSSPSTRSCRSYFDCPGPSGLDKTNVVRQAPGAGETKLAESGHTGIDVEYFRVITQPGSDPVRQRFFWRLQDVPEQVPRREGCAGLDAHHGCPTGNNGPTCTGAVDALTTQRGGHPFRSTCSRRLPILHRKPYCRAVEGMTW